MAVRVYLWENCFLDMDGAIPKCNPLREWGVEASDCEGIDMKNLGYLFNIHKERYARGYAQM